MPSWIRRVPEARRCWQQLGPKLARLGTLTSIDGHVFARYCVFWSQWRVAVDVLTTQGPTVPLADGDGEGGIGYVDRPEVVRAMRLDAELIKLERKLGLSAADRAALAMPQAGKAAPDDLEARLFSRG
jgi:P27 family predicted phage terminase small subunit